MLVGCLLLKTYTLVFSPDSVFKSMYSTPYAREYQRFLAKAHLSVLVCQYISIRVKLSSNSHHFSPVLYSYTLRNN